MPTTEADRKEIETLNREISIMHDKLDDARRMSETLVEALVFKIEDLKRAVLQAEESADYFKKERDRLGEENHSMRNTGMSHMHGFSDAMSKGQKIVAIKHIRMMFHEVGWNAGLKEVKDLVDNITVKLPF
jgi:ribosomal protein L7/L12